MTMNVKDRKFWTEFLKLYQSLPCLWRVKSEDYYNRVLKAASYNKLIKKLREVDEDATRETVVKKINNFRTNYRRDLKKLQKNLQSGTETEEQFQSTLWYFDLLKFLEDQESPHESSSSNMNVKYEIQNSLQDYGSDNSMAQPYSSPSPSPAASPSPGQSPSPSPQRLPSPPPVQAVLHEAPKSFISSASSSKKRKFNSNVELQSLEFVGEQPMKIDNDDAINILGKSWSAQYAELSNSQKVFARTIFSDILYHGCLNHLSEQTVEDIHNVLMEISNSGVTSGQFARFDSPQT